MDIKNSVEQPSDSKVSTPTLSDKSLHAVCTAFHLLILDSVSCKKPNLWKIGVKNKQQIAILYVLKCESYLT
jgi:hypothetical protein